MSPLNRRQFTSLAVVSLRERFHHSGQTLRSRRAKRQDGVVAVVGVNGRGGEHLREFHNDKRSRFGRLWTSTNMVGNLKADMVAGLQGKRPPTVYTDIAEEGV